METTFSPQYLYKKHLSWRRYGFSFVSVKPDLCSACIIFQLYAVSCYTGPRYIKNRQHRNIIDRAVHMIYAMKKLLSGHRI